VSGIFPPAAPGPDQYGHTRPDPTGQPSCRPGSGRTTLCSPRRGSARRTPIPA